LKNIEPIISLDKSNQIDEKFNTTYIDLLTTKVCSTTAASPTEAAAVRATRAMQRTEAAMAAMNKKGGAATSNSKHYHSVETETCLNLRGVDASDETATVSYIYARSPALFVVPLA
jgi:hypothetical protein